MVSWTVYCEVTDQRRRRPVHHRDAAGGRIVADRVGQLDLVGALVGALGTLVGQDTLRVTETARETVRSAGGRKMRQ